jgi:sugar/nucleoside kinase (ribokinase family)
VVLSDPDYNNGAGERLGIGQLGEVENITPDMLDEDFFKSDYCIFGGSAFTYKLHSNLTALLKKAQENQATTIVNTIFDSENEKKDPVGKWPMGDSDETYKLIDLLIMNRSEALRYSGEKDVEAAFEFFVKTEVSTFIITNDDKYTLAYSNGDLFEQVDKLRLPVSNAIKLAQKK